MNLQRQNLVLSDVEKAAIWC